MPVTHGFYEEPSVGLFDPLVPRQCARERGGRFFTSSSTVIKKVTFTKILRHVLSSQKPVIILSLILKPLGCQHAC